MLSLVGTVALLLLVVGIVVRSPVAVADPGRFPDSRAAGEDHWPVRSSPDHSPSATSPIGWALVGSLPGPLVNVTVVTVGSTLIRVHAGGVELL
jgi:hypothetical protein